MKNLILGSVWLVASVISFLIAILFVFGMDNVEMAGLPIKTSAAFISSIIFIVGYYASKNYKNTLLLNIFLFLPFINILIYLYLFTSK